MTRPEFDLIMHRLGILFENPCPPEIIEYNWGIWKDRPKDDLLDSIQIKESEKTPRPNHY
tara:strand:- start:879 stop:1058 length:180 start_codon:yes stop_codon:yes gene_type:complete